MKFLQVVVFLLAANNSVANSIDFLPLPANNIVTHTYYILSYNEAYEEANWVYYSLTDSMVLNTREKRTNRFKMDQLVDTKSSQSSDYTNSGYDRGHLCPAGDMRFDPVAMKESFLMSNISPQNRDFNSGIWNELEIQVREWAKKEHRLYVVTGPIFNDNKGSIGLGKVLVPGYFFKIIYDPTDVPKMIAFVLPNEKSDHPLIDFAVATDEVEKLTGFDFFSQLPDGIEKKFESNVQFAGWFDHYTPEPPIVSQSQTRIVQAKSDMIFFTILISVIVLVALFVYIKN